MTAILGISAFYHDSAAALLVDGRIVAAAQEERFSRIKHDDGFPRQAIEYCLRSAGLVSEDLDCVGFYDKPLLKFERILETYLNFAPRGLLSFVRAMPPWLRMKLHVPRYLRAGLAGYRKRFVFTEHHESHAASAFFPSPFTEAAILTIDGVGEWATATCGIGRDNRITLLEQLSFPHSPGLLYSAFTYYCGFAVNSGEYKLMGLAPYGDPKYVDTILSELMDLKPDGSFRLDMSYFDYCHGATMTSAKFERLLGGPPRRPDEPITERHLDVAASIQYVTEEVMLRIARHAHAQTGMKHLCLAGGVALNCVGNGRILREGPFDDVWIQPAAGDAGGALGVAQFIWHQLLNQPRDTATHDQQHGSLLGPEFSDAEVRDALSGDCPFEYIEDDGLLCERVAEELADGKLVGWFQGRLEFGPRALGARSILADPRNFDARRRINDEVKFRESFRPFAPAVLAEHADEYFDMRPGQESPYMLLTAPVRESRRLPMNDALRNAQGLDRLQHGHSTIPAVTHVDYSARVQTVSAGGAQFRRLLEAFYRRTGCPVLVNTSFNWGWDPIVCTPREAYEVFRSSALDVLCLGHVVLVKDGAKQSGDAVSRPPRSAIAPGPRQMRPPTSAELRYGGLIIAATFALLAGILWGSLESAVPAGALGITGLVIAAAYYAVPAWRRTIYNGWMGATAPLGWLVSSGLLAAAYYLVLTPIGVALRLIGHDPLRRRVDRGTATYWQPRAPEADAERYFQQF